MASVIVCPSCDLAHRAAMLPASKSTRCARCRAPLQRPENGSIDAAIAVALCALVLFLLSNAYPLVEIQYNGATRATTLLGAAGGFFSQGHIALAALVFITIVLGPFLQIAGILYLLIPLRRERRAPGQNTVFRLLAQVRAWIFVEVFMLGTLVALVRLSTYTRVIPGVALWSCGLLMFTLAALISRTTPGQFWYWVQRSRA
jgi:paraquat-inducible protein A